MNYLKICCRLFVFAFLIQESSLASQSQKQLYSIVTESELFGGRVFQTLVTIHEAPEPVEIEAKLTHPLAHQFNDSYSIHWKDTIESPGSKLIQLDVPSDWHSAPCFLEINGSGGLIFTHNKDVFLRSKELQVYSIYIILDKDFYTSDDTVRYSVLVLDQSQKTIADGEILQITLELTSECSYSIQRSNVTTQRGVHRGEFKVDDHSHTNTVNIVADYKGFQKNAFFTVAKEANKDDLKINLKLIAPKRCTTDNTQMEVTLEATYYSGFPIGGNVTLILKELKKFLSLIGSPPPHENHCYRKDCTIYKLEQEPFLGSKQFVVDLPRSTRRYMVYILYAFVRDELTGHIQWTSKEIKVTDSKIYFEESINIELQKPFFAPGLPLMFQIAYKDELGDDNPSVANNTVTVRAIYSDLELNSTLGEDIHQYLVSELQEKNTITVQPPPNAVSVTLEVEVDGNIYARKAVSRFPYNAQDKFVTIVPESLDVEAGSNVTVDIHASDNVDFITYQVVSIRSYAIVHWGSVAMSEENPQQLSFPVTKDLVSHFYLIVYGVTDEGDFVADNRHFVTKEENPVQMALDVAPLEAEPGELVNFTVHTDPNTVIFIKSWAPKPQPKKVESYVDAFLEELDIKFDPDLAHLSQHESFETGLIEWQTIFSNTSHLQERLFRPARLMLTTNSALQNIPESDEESYRNPPEEQTEKEKMYKRKRFSRNWLWNVVVVGDTGAVTFAAKAPDRIANWKTTMIGIDGSHRIGYHSGPQIQISRPLFTLIDMPTSLVRGEAVLLRVYIFQEEKGDINVTFISKDQRLQILDTTTHKILPAYWSKKQLLANETKYNQSLGELTHFLISPLYAGRLEIEVVVSDDKGNSHSTSRSMKVKNAPHSDKPFVYEAKEALRYGEDPECLVFPDAKNSFSPVPIYNISFQVNSVNDERGSLRVNACIRYIQKGEFSDFMLELELPSGFAVEPETNFTSVTGVPQDAYNVTVVGDKKIVWEFFQLPSSESLCVSVDAKRAFVVYNIKPARVTVFTSINRATARRAGIFYEVPSFESPGQNLFE